MHKFLLSMAIAVISASAMAAPSTLAKAKAHAASSIKPAATVQVNLNNNVSNLYDPSLETPNYYILLSDDQTATYNKNTGDVNMGTGYLVALDLYNYASDPVELAPGTYHAGGELYGVGAWTFDSDYTQIAYYENGNCTFVANVVDDIKVQRGDDGIYTIIASWTDPDNASNVVKVSYTGRISMTNVNEKPTAYPMIRYDVDAQLDKGGIAFYQGVTSYSNNGVTMLNLYSEAYDKETGSMNADGWNLCMMIAHKRIVKKESYEIVPGDYDNSTKLERFTWYPCREIEYMFGEQSVTLPFGSYIRRLNSNAADRYTYAYLKSGKFTIMDNGDGTYSGTLDAETDLGYHVTATWSGEISVNFDNASFKSSVSNLTDDVDLDFSKIEKGRIYNAGITGGCRSFKVDLGSPSGKDPGINQGGDLLRMEFLVPTSDAVLKQGMYNVVLDRWNDNELAAGSTYEPYSLNKGYFTNKGGSDGSRYEHFKEGSTCVVDLLGPVEEGSVFVSTDDYHNYRFEIALVDDAGFELRGVYDGPIEYNYSPEAIDPSYGAIGSVDADSAVAVRAVVEAGQILVLNAGNVPVSLYSVTGALCLRGTADRAIDASGLPHGIYILNVNNNNIKISL